MGEQRGDKGRTHSKCQEEKYLKRLFKNSVVGANASGWILHTPLHHYRATRGPPSNPSIFFVKSVKSVKITELPGPLRQIRQNHGAPWAPPSNPSNPSKPRSSSGPYYPTMVLSAAPKQTRWCGLGDVPLQADQARSECILRKSKPFETRSGIFGLQQAAYLYRTIEP